MISMIMILACHICQYYDIEWCWWLNVGVQVFFVISGYLYGLKEISNPIDFLRKTYFKILQPYWIFIGFAVVLYALFAPQEISFIRAVKSIVCADTIKGLGHLWFVGYILFCYAITPYLYWLRTYLVEFNIKRKLIVYTTLWVLLQVLSIAFGSYFEPNHIGCYFIGFVIADIESHSKVVRKTIERIFYLLAIIVNGTILVVKYGSIETQLSTMVVYKVMCYYGHLLLGVSLFFAITHMTRSSSRYNIYLSFSDKYSYYIYIVHNLFVLSPFTLLTVTPMPCVNIILALVAIMASAVSLSFVTIFFKRNLQLNGLHGH